MNDNENKKIQYFIALCDDLITCKFLVAESKIQRLLVALTETPAVYELVSDCMEQFNRDREMAKAFVTDGKGKFWCTMPTEEYKIIALVFCVIADIDQKKIDFTDFIKRFFDDENGINCYTSFARRMILPFRELIAEAFGFPKRYTHNEEEKVEELQETATVEEEVSTAEEEQEEENAASTPQNQVFCNRVADLTRDILLEVDVYKNDLHTEEFKAVIQQLNKAAKAGDLDLMYALFVGARYASKNVKHVKFLMKELCNVFEANL